MDRTIHLLAIFVFLLNSTPGFARRQRLRFPSFNCPGGNCSTERSSRSSRSSNNELDFTPLTKTPTERTTAVNGIPVPENAIGYKFTNGNIEWVFDNNDTGISSSVTEVPPNHGTPASFASTPARPQSIAPAPRGVGEATPIPETPQSSVSLDDEESENRDFECIKSEKGFRPQHKIFKKALGAGTMANIKDCELAVKASKNGVVCAATGLPNGFKPTYFKGITTSRPDWGYVGGSSMTLENCLDATEQSSATHICYWGGSDWYATHPTGDKSSKGGPFKSLQLCIQSYSGTPRGEKENSVESPFKPISAKNVRSAPTIPSSGKKEESAIAVIKNPVQDSHANPSGLKSHELINQNCITCHNGTTAKRFPDWMAESGELERRLQSDNPKEKDQARSMIRNLHNVLIENETMPPRSTKEQSDFLSNPESNKFKAWIQQEHTKLKNEHTEGTSTASHGDQKPRPIAAASNSVQIIGQENLNAYRSMLPKVENEELNNILKDPNTIFFDRKSMVPAYQDPSTPVNGVRTSEPGFRGAPFGKGAENLYLDKDGNLRMFSKGVGLDTSSSTGTFHFLHLPKDEKGNLQKIKVIKRIVPPDDTPTYDWVFPIGTVSGEVVFNKDSSNKTQVVEIRTRKKDSPQGAWAPDIMRPFPTSETLKEKLNDIVDNNDSLKNEAKGLLAHLSNPKRLTPIEIKRNGYEKGNLGSVGGTDVLPNMSEGMVKELLRTPFKSSLAAEWDKNGTVTAFAPTTNQANGLVPQHGMTGATRVDRESCNKCHEESNKPIYKFFNESNPSYYSSIRAYGNLPGSDRNLRFTIFDQKYYKDFGNDGKGDNRKINDQLRPILDIQ